MSTRKGKSIIFIFLVTLLTITFIIPTPSNAGPLDRWTSLQIGNRSSSDTVVLNEWVDLVQTYYGLAYGNGKVVVVGAGGRVAVTSDLTYWGYPSTGTVEDLLGAVYGNSGFVAVGTNGTVLKSSDGAAWASAVWTQQNPKPAGTLNDVAFANAAYVTVGAGGLILNSRDAATWTGVESGTTATLNGITYGSKFVAVGQIGTILNSTDGTIWSQVSSGTTATLYGITYGNGKYIAAGTNGTILVSSDGASWSQAPSGTYMTLFDVTYGNKTFLAVGTGGIILESTNPATAWTQKPLSATNDLLDDLYVTFPNNVSYFLIVGQGSLIQRSDPIFPSMSANKAFLSFGSVEVNATSSPQTVTITNTGNADLAISSVNKTGAVEFAVTQNCTAGVIPPAQSCTVTASFSPTSLGEKSASIAIASNAPYVSSLSIPLTGTGFAPPVLSVTHPASTDFGDLGVGCSSATKSLGIANTGIGDLVISTTGMASGDSKSFGFDKGTCASLTPTIAPGGSCTMRIVFSPTETGAKATALTLTSNDPTQPNHSCDLSGNGNASGLPDIPIDFWARDYVYAMYNNNIMPACGSGGFCPDQNITRADMAVFILKTMGIEPAASCAGLFADVNASTVGTETCKYIEKFSTLGITAGCGGANYCPNDYLTRAQMAVFFAKALNAQPGACLGSFFGDVNSTVMTAGFCSYIEKFKDLNITAGCGSGNFCPDVNVSRAQMSVFLTKAFDIFFVPRNMLMVGKTGTGSGSVKSEISGVVPASTPKVCSQDECPEAYDPNTLISLTATADGTSNFIGWSGSCSGTANPVTVTLDISKTCKANFALKTYTVSTSAGAGGSISPASAVVNHGATKSFTVTPNAGYGILSVTGCGGSLSGNTYTTGPITAICTVTAAFTANLVNGQCGPANGQTFPTAPTTDLCSAGSPKNYSGTGPWTWNCEGSNGGSTAACTAYKETTPGTGVSYTEVKLTEFTPGVYRKDLLFEKIGAKPAQKFYKVIVPSACSTLQLASSGAIDSLGYINVNNLYSGAPFSDASTAYNIYTWMMENMNNTGKQGTLGVVYPADGKTYYYSFTEDPGTESITFSAPLSSIYYVEIVNETNRTGTYHVRAGCW
jgi:hypothetical protein